MSKITRDDVLKLAALSKIKLSDDEIEKFVEELSAIVQYVEQIDSVDASGLDPTDQVTGLKNVMRRDELINYQANKEDLLKNLPQREEDYIKVKRVLA